MNLDDRTFPEAIGDATTWRDLTRIAGCGCAAGLAALAWAAWWLVG